MTVKIRVPEMERDTVSASMSPKLEGASSPMSAKGNEQFLSKAPENVIVEQKRRLAEETETKDQLEAALERLKELG